MKRKVFLKLFTILLCSTVFIFSVVYFGSRAYAQYFENDIIYEEGTSVAARSIEGLSRQEAFELIETEMKKWMEESVTAIQYKEKSIEISNAIYLFDLSSTLNQIQMGQSNRMAVMIDQSKLEEELLGISAKLDLNDIDMAGLTTELKKAASMLNVTSDKVQLLPYIINENPNAELVTATLPVGNAIGELTNLVNDITTIEIKPQSTFSLLNYMENYGDRAYSQETLSMLASGLYEVILETNFDIVERHISSELSSYAQLGYEAKVAKDLKQDLVFNNHNETPFTIDLSIKDNQLVVVLKGYSFLYQYTIKKSNEETFKQETIVQFDPLLQFWELHVVNAGKAGKKIDIVRETKDETGMEIKREEIASDYYAPIHRKEVRSLMASGPGTGEGGTPSEDGGVDNSDGESNQQQGEETEDSANSDSDNSTEENRKELSILTCLEELGADSDATDETKFTCELILKSRDKNNQVSEAENVEMNRNKE